MKAFDKASLALVPDGIKDGKLYSIKPTDGSGDFTFTRGSNLAATRVDENGLIEKGRENMVLYSNKFDESNWNKYNGASISPTQVEGPFGEINAWQVTFGTNDDSRLEQQITTVNGNIYNFSVWARVTSGTKNVRLGGVGSLVSKTLTTTWQRIESYAVETDTNGFPQLRKDNAEGQYTVEIYGFQFEQGLVATDYIETGATTAQAGILEDLPRIDYTGSTPSLLMEPSGTNLVVNSEYFDSWTTLGNGTVTQNYGISPEGVQNSSRFQAVASGDRVYRNIGTVNANETFSVYMKGSGPLLIDVGGGNNFYPDLTSEWVRYEFTTSQNGTNGNIQFKGNGGTLDVELYGAQFERNSYATSYIPTYGASATRGNESIPLQTINPTSNNTFTVFFELHLDNMPLVSNEQFLNLKDFANTAIYQSFRMFEKNGEHVIVPYFNEDSTYPYSTNIEANLTDTGKVVFRANGDGSYDMFIRFNGTTTKRSASGLTAYNLGRINFTNQSPTNLKSFLVFDDLLSDAECIRLTTKNLTLTKPAFVGGAGLNNFVVAVSGDIAGGSGTIETNWQWQISNDGNTWADVNGATNDYYTIPNNTNLLGKYIRVEQSINDEYGTLTVVASDGQQILQLAGLFDSVAGTAGYSLNRLRSQTPFAAAARVTRDGTHFTTIGFTSDNLFDSAAAMAYATQTGNIAQYVFDQEFNINTFGRYGGEIDVLATPFRGEENVLVYEVANDAIDTQRFFSESVLDPTLGHTIRFQAKVFIPSNQKVDKVRIWTGYGTDGYIDVTTTDTWVDVNQTLLIASGTQARVQAYNDTNFSFNAPGDKFYIKDLTITDITPNLHVQTLYDQSGNNNHAVQNALQSMPMIIEDGVLVEENGNPALKFDGVDDYLTLPASIGTPFTGQGKAISSFSVSSIVSDNKTLWSITGTGNDDYYFSSHDGSKFKFFARGGGGTLKSSTSSSTFGAGQYLKSDILPEEVASVQSGDMYIDGTQEVTSFDYATASKTLDRGGGIGALVRSSVSGNFNGKHQEIIIFNSDQSKIREGIERVMANRYNIDLS